MIKRMTEMKAKIVIPDDIKPTTVAPTSKPQGSVNSFDTKAAVKKQVVKNTITVAGTAVMPTSTAATTRPAPVPESEPLAKGSSTIDVA